MAAAPEVIAEIGQWTLILDWPFRIIQEHFSAHNATQKDISYLPVDWARILGPGKMQKGTFHTASGCCRRRLPRMVGLNRSSGNQHIGAGFYGISDQVLEFASLVAATFQAGQVISLYP